MIWHETILNTQFYKELQAALQLEIHHRPEGAADRETTERMRRLTTMKRLYLAIFSAEPKERKEMRVVRQMNTPLAPVGTYVIFIALLDQKKCRLSVRREMTIDSIKYKLQARVGIPPSG